MNYITTKLIIRSKEKHGKWGEDEVKSGLNRSGSDFEPLLHSPETRLNLPEPKIGLFDLRPLG